MPLKPEYENCRKGKHRPTDIDTQRERNYVRLTATCETCGADMEFELDNDVWDAVHPAVCQDCEEAPPYCECPE